MGNLLKAALVAAAVESLAQPRLNNLPRKPGAYYPSTHAQHVGVIVVPGGFCRENVMAEGCTDAGHLIGCYAHAYPRAAKQYAPLEFAPCHRVCYALCNVRIVHRVWGVGSKVHCLYPQLLQQGHYLVLERVTTVVCSYCYLHDLNLAPAMFSNASSSRRWSWSAVARYSSTVPIYGSFTSSYVPWAYSDSV